MRKAGTTSATNTALRYAMRTGREVGTTNAKGRQSVRSVLAFRPARKGTSGQQKKNGRYQPERRARAERLRSDKSGLRRRQNQSPRRPRGGSQAAGDVHRLDRAVGLAPSRLRSRRQLDRRGAGWVLRPDQRDDSHRRLGHSRRQRAGIPDRSASERALRRRGRADGAARRRQVRQRQLQGVGRLARRRRLGRQRAVAGASTSRSGATGRSSNRSTSAGSRRPTSRRPGRTKKRGTKITFSPDNEIFETVEFSFDTLAQRLRELAFLNAGISSRSTTSAKRRATSSSTTAASSRSSST